MQYFRELAPISEKEIESRVLAVLNGQEGKFNQIQVYKTLLGMIDLTTLEGADTQQRIKDLCHQAMAFADGKTGVPPTAAVCVYPPFVKLAKQELAGTQVEVASVAGAFPSGQSPIHIKVEEVKYAVDQGADEIDMVISRGKFLEGKYDTVFEEIQAIKAVCDNAHLKVILETGELDGLNHVRNASLLAIAAGADFIKTSTGKVKPAATLPAFLVMLDVIKTHYEQTGKRIGIKPAGGISEPQDALNYYLLVENVLGEAWLNKSLFRVGASRLAGKLHRAIIEE